MKNNYIIGSINKTTGDFSISARPKIHDTLEDAKFEASRLASLDSSKKFVIFKIAEICYAKEIIWD